MTLLPQSIDEYVVEGDLAYSDFLPKWCVNACFEIIELRKVKEDRLKAGVRIMVNKGKSMRIFIVLVKTKAKRGIPETFEHLVFFPQCL